MITFTQSISGAIANSQAPQIEAMVSMYAVTVAFHLFSSIDNQMTLKLMGLEEDALSRLGATRRSFANGDRTQFIPTTLKLVDRAGSLAVTVAGDIKRFGQLDGAISLTTEWRIEGDKLRLIRELYHHGE